MTTRALKDNGIKYTPEIEFVYDLSIERGMRVLEALDELDAESAGEEFAQDENQAE